MSVETNRKQTLTPEEKREAFLADQKARDLVEVLELAAGRRVLWHIIDDLAGINWINTATDSSVFFSEGRRSVGAGLVKEIQDIAPNGFITMLAEALKQERDTQVIANGGSAAERKLDNG